MTELGPCPFCASTRVEVESSPEEGWTRMRCGTCGARGPIGDSETMAERLWRFRIYDCVWCGSSNVETHVMWGIGKMHQIRCWSCGRKTDFHASGMQAFAEWRDGWLEDRDPAKRIPAEEVKE